MPAMCRAAPCLAGQPASRAWQVREGRAPVHEWSETQGKKEPPEQPPPAPGSQALQARSGPPNSATAGTPGIRIPRGMPILSVSPGTRHPPASQTDSALPYPPVAKHVGGRGVGRYRPARGPPPRAAISHCRQGAAASLCRQGAAASPCRQGVARPGQRSTRRRAHTHRTGRRAKARTAALAGRSRR